jgi:predicted transcriptional regulator
MVCDIPRTARDDALAALRKLDDTEREIRSWRAHLQRVIAEPEVPVAMQAVRCATIVTAVTDEARKLTHDALLRSALPVG